MDFSNDDIKRLNEFTGFLNFVPSWIFRKYINCRSKTIFVDTGNQFGKTCMVAYSYVLRVAGMHPVPEKNVLYFECREGHLSSPMQSFFTRKCPHCQAPVEPHIRNSRIIRFASQNLPGQTANTSSDEGMTKSAEVKNTQYPEFKKWLPPFLIKKDLTARNPSLLLKDPYKGDDIVIEFVSYNQSTQAMAGVQRMSLWEDESPTIEFHEEQKPRLFAEDGDNIITYTPVDSASFLFSEIYDRAKVYYRTKAVIDYMASRGIRVPQIEQTGSTQDIAVFQAATDDNPTLKPEVLEKHFENINDPDLLAIRRYGIFKHISGRIFKNFDYKIHFIQTDKYFPDGTVPQEWVHGRAIDFHAQTPWAIIFACLSYDNEMFIWGELEKNPEIFTCAEIMKEVCMKGRDYRFRLNLIDPFAEATKKDTKSSLDDINRITHVLKHEGIGFGGTWQTWDTKGEYGRDEIRERLKNSALVGRPFNNRVEKPGKPVEHLPTLWILNRCPLVAKSLNNWRWEEWSDPGALFSKDAKNKPEQKWSHFCTALEALCKEPHWKPSRKEANAYQPRRIEAFQGRKVMTNNV